MNDSLEALLYGMQFRKLLEKLLEPVEEEYGLNKVDLQIMFYLNSAGSRNASKDIVQLGKFTRGHISQSLGRLQRKGYLIIEHDAEDRRCSHNYLTHKSDEIIQKLQDAFDRVRDIIFRGITEEEQAILLSVVQRMNQNINNAISP